MASDVSPRKKNLLFVMPWYAPRGGYGRVPTLAARFAAEGYRVQAISAVPYNFGDESIVDGYKMRLWQKETLNGVDVVRLPLYISQNKSGFKRMLCYASFGLSAATLGQFGIVKPDVVVCYNLPTLRWAARTFRLFRGSKIVYIIQDLWPESVFGSGMATNNGLFKRVLQRWCDSFYRSADALTCISKGFKANLVARGVPADKIEVVYNWTNEDGELPAEKVRDPNDPFVVVYAGNMGSVQGLDVVLDAAKLALERGANVIFRLIGAGVELDALKNRANALNLTNVEFVPKVPSSQINAEFSKADALLVHLKKLDIFKITIPSKTQAYLRAGKPILCGLEGEARELVCGDNAEGIGPAGVAFEQENPESLLDAIERTRRATPEELRETGRNGRERYRTTTSFDVAFERWRKLVDRL